MRRATLLAAGAALLLVVGCPKKAEPVEAPPPAAAVRGLPSAPDAVLLVDVPRVARLQAALVEWAGRIGAAGAPIQKLLPTGLSLAGIDGGARALVSVRPTGAIIAVETADARAFRRAVDVVASEQDLARRPLVGATEVLVPKGGGPAVALVRVAASYALVVPGPDDPLAEAALLEALVEGMPDSPLQAALEGATSSDQTLLTFVGGPDVGDALGAGVLGGAWRDAGARGLAGEAVVVPDGVVVTGRVLLPQDAPARALLSPSPAPPGACALDEGAALTLRLPVAGLPDDEAATAGLPLASEAGARLQGQIVLALYPAQGGAPTPGDMLSRVSLAVVGRPRDADAAAALAASLALPPDQARVTTRTIGGRTIRTVEPLGGPSHRVVHAVVDQDLFALSVGGAAPVERAAAMAGACPRGDDAPLRLSVDGAALGRLLEGPSGVASALLAGLLGDEAAPATPSAVLRHVDVDAAARPVSEGAHLEAKIAISR